MLCCTYGDLPDASTGNVIGRQINGFEKKSNTHITLLDEI